MPSKLSKNPTSVMLIIAGLILILWGLVSAFDLALNGVTKTGVVVSYERIHHPRNSPVHSHTIEVDGDLIEVTLDKKTKLGTQLTLQYVPERSKTYWVKGSLGKPDVIGLTGLIFILFGLIGWFVDSQH